MNTPFEPNKQVLRLFTDLTEQIRQLVGLDAGRDAGFMDMSMEGGESWLRQLLRAGGKAQVFLALLSEPYLTSSYCAMEWDLFGRRTVLDRKSGRPADANTAVIPILWAPTEAPMPKVVSAVQRFDPKDLPDPTFSPQYKRNGLLGLCYTNPAAYDAIIWKLALRIQRIQYRYWVRPVHRMTTKGLRRDFGNVS